MLAVDGDRQPAEPRVRGCGEKTVTFKLEQPDFVSTASFIALANSLQGSLDEAQLTAKISEHLPQVLRELLKRISGIYPGSQGYMAKATALVSVLEKVPWQDVDEQDFLSFSKILVNLTSVCPSIAPAIFRLILTEACTKRSTRAEGLLQNLVRFVPSSMAAVLSSLEYNFPYYSRPSEHLSNYLELLLALMRNVSALRPKILELIIEKFLTIDVAIQMEATHLPDELDVIDEASEKSDDDEEKEAEELEALDSDLLRRSSSPIALNMADLMGKLDSGLVLLFDYFSSLKDSPEDLRATFDCLMQTFEKCMLPTFRSRCTPFILLYVTSLSPNLTDVFLGFLMKRLYHVFDQPGEGRKRTVASTASLLTVVTASYIGSFVARAKFLPPKLVRLSFDMLLTWCLRFLGDLPNHLRSGVKALRSSNSVVSERVAVFYAVAQAVMYIFCFRHRLLMQPHDTSGVTELKVNYRNFLLPILQSSLNPLKWCMSSVVEEFSRLTEEYDLIDCHHIMDKSARRSAPPQATTSADVGISKFDDQPPSAQAAENTGAFLGDLDSYFPFDPLILKNASAYISSDLYNEWTNEVESDVESNDDDEVPAHVDIEALNRDLLFSNPAWQGLAHRKGPLQ